MLENLVVFICVVICIVLVGYLIQDIRKNITIQREVTGVIERCEIKIKEVEKEQLKR